MELWLTSAVNQRAQKGAFPPPSGFIEISNEISALSMAGQVEFETKIRPQKVHPENPGKWPILALRGYRQRRWWIGSFAKRTEASPLDAFPKHAESVFGTR